MKVLNPTKDELSVLYKGVRYTVEPEGELSGVPEEAAVWWRTQVHQFVTVKADDVSEETPETLEEKVQEEESAEEEVEDEEESEEAEEDEGGADLDSLTRGELNELAEEKGLNPSDYRNKAELIDALK